MLLRRRSQKEAMLKDQIALPTLKKSQMKITGKFAK
jgi:hypothetical protein